MKYVLSLYLSFSDETVELELSVAATLNTLFLNENTVIVIRFWKAMLEALTKLIEKGAYCHCCSVLQVRGYSVCFFNAIYQRG